MARTHTHLTGADDAPTLIGSNNKHNNMPTCGKGHQVDLITVQQEMMGVGECSTGFGYETSKTSL